MIIRSGLIASLITGSMILGVLLVMNGKELTSVAGFTDAYTRWPACSAARRRRSTGSSAR